MFYSGNDNYMQDIYYYNQNSNTYPGVNGYPNNINNNFWGQNAPYMSSNMMQNNINPSNINFNNIDMLYPSIYRVLMPVILRVLQNNSYQYLNEDILNNMVDTVYNIVEGQVDYNDDPDSNSNSGNQSSNNNNSSNSSNSQSNRNNETRAQSTNSNSSISNSRRDNPLLRDIIKILIIKEILRKNQVKFNQMSQSQLYNPNYNMYI